MSEVKSKPTWIVSIEKMLDNVVVEQHLPKGSLYVLFNNEKKAKVLVPSYSVSIYEPDYPYSPSDKREQNQVVLTFFVDQARNKSNEFEIRVRKKQADDLAEFLPKDFSLMPQTKTDQNNKIVRIRGRQQSENLVDFVKKNVEYCIERYVSKEDMFGCCGLYIKCSDAKKCLHKNLLFSKACYYRANLENGIIFYGKNKNSGD